MGQAAARHRAETVLSVGDPWKQSHIQRRKRVNRKGHKAHQVEDFGFGVITAKGAKSAKTFWVLYYHRQEFAPVAQMFCEPKSHGFRFYSRQGAKHAKFGRLNSSLHTNSRPLIRILRLGVFAEDPPNSYCEFFARDHPRLTGTRSAPYENLRVRSPW